MDSKHSGKSALSSVPSKSFVDFLVKAESRVSRMVAKGEKKTKRKPKSRKGGSGDVMGNGVSSRVVDVPAARLTRLSSVKIGLMDRHSEEISFVTGKIVTGQTGTLGTTNQVYFQDLSGAVWNGITPVVFNDTSGVRVPSFVTDVVKHYARVRVQAAELDLLPISSSTSNGTTILCAPVRGAVQNPGASATTGTLTQNTQDQLLSMAGSCQFGSWERQRIGLTSSIAGGSGPRQNEFSTSNSGWQDSSGDQQLQPGGICGFAISGTGQSPSTGVNTHLVVVRMRVDLLDFIGGLFSTVSFTARNPPHELKEQSPAQGPALASASHMTGRPSQRPTPMSSPIATDQKPRPASAPDVNESAAKGAISGGWFRA